MPAFFNNTLDVHNMQAWFLNGQSQAHMWAATVGKDTTASGFLVDGDGARANGWLSVKHPKEDKWHVVATASDLGGKHTVSLATTALYARL